MAVLIVIPGVLLAQGTREPRFAAGVELVEVHVTVSDGAGAPVEGLSVADFVVLENGVPQEVVAFGADDVPLTVAVGLDRSFSMAGEPLRLAKAAVSRFLEALGPRDRAFVLAVGPGAEILAPVSAVRSEQLDAVAAVQAWGATALRDAVVSSLRRLEIGTGRQAVVVFSDGQDRESLASVGELLDVARRSKAMVYPVAIGRRRPPEFPELAALTGGRSFLVRDMRQLDNALQGIAVELRHQYLLGYTLSSGRAQAGAWRSIEVRLASPRPGVQVRARNGYVAP